MSAKPVHSVVEGLEDPIEDPKGQSKDQSTDNPSASWARGPATWIKRLQVTNFRNYDHVALDLDARPVILCGDNGAGKTNLLEAVSFLAPGRGLRRAQLADALRRNPFAPAANETEPDDTLEPTAAPQHAGMETPWSISSLLHHNGDDVRIGTMIEPGLNGAPGFRRVVRINREPVPSGELAQYVSLVWLTPQLDRLFQEGPSSRRRFIDRLTLAHDPEHLARVSAYDRALRERQKVLNGPHADKSWLDAIEIQLAEHGIAIAAARREMVEALSRECAGNAIPGFPTPALHLKGALDDLLAQRAALEAEETYAQELSANRSYDRHTGRTRFGPHTSDLAVWNCSKNLAARDCSTGEQKALLISIVLASAHLCVARTAGQAPLVLLDEVVAHLDETRRGLLFDAICDLGCQAWMTGTDESTFAMFGDRAQRIKVDNGAVVHPPRGRTT